MWPRPPVAGRAPSATVAAPLADAAPQGPRRSASCPRASPSRSSGRHARLDTEPWLIPVGIRESDLVAGRPGDLRGRARADRRARRGRASRRCCSPWPSPCVRAVTADGIDPVWGDLRASLAARATPAWTTWPSARRTSRRCSPPPRVAPRPAGPADRRRRAASTTPTRRSPGLISAPSRPTCCVIAAGRSDDLRGLYSHWTKTVRKSRCGRAAAAERRLRRRPARGPHSRAGRRSR